jgi:hypothetical protein
MEEQATPEAATTPMSFGEKVVNIFTAPAELFENVRLTPRTTSNWLIPMLVFIVIAVLLNQLILTNPSLVNQMTTLMRKGIDEAVTKGSMTAQQAEQAEQFMRADSIIFRVQSIVGIVLVSPIALFLLALVYWLLGKWGMNASAPYMKVVEVVGLTFFISILETIVTTGLQYGLDSLFAGPNLAVFVSNFDLQNKLHMALAKINVFTIWDLTVVSIGLSKLFQRHLPKVLVLVFALWIVWSVFTVATGMHFGG